MKYTKLVAAVALATAAACASAQTFRWSSQGDFYTFDFAAISETLNFNAAMTVYEPLCAWGPDLKLEPRLAQSWKYDKDKGGWFFYIRKGVKFHEGETLTADDVVFSLKRALSKRSALRSYTAGFQDVSKVDDYTVFLKTLSGSPVTLNQLNNLFIMNKSWAEKHGCTQVQDFNGKEENYATHHANGTGPFILKSRNPEIKTVFVKNEGWWDNKHRRGNCDVIEYTPIKSAATRTAALVSGELDFVLDPPPQDLQRLRNEKTLKIETGAETRAILIALDQGRDESPYIQVEGKTKVNPFKDIRVRKALYMAINMDAIKKSVMRGLCEPSGVPIARAIDGWTKELGKRYPFDPKKAKQLLTEAGYPNGFTFTLDCPTNRYMNDEAIGKAVVAMWAKVGLNAKLNPIMRAKFFPKVTHGDTSACLYGWGVATLDGLFPLQSLLMTQANGNGYSNLGFVSNKEVDELGEKIKTESDAKVRRDMMTKAFTIAKENFLTIPLHSQMIAWAMKKDVNVVLRPDNKLALDWVIKGKK